MVEIHKNIESRYLMKQIDMTNCISKALTNVSLIVCSKCIGQE